ncbi:hypothetical protein [uncultured Litoreibacter sp.]|uniref:hypothetical protein n=1 Tax=uncultured Litoreibacter sp. TaxID=1392394 RepID=UPI00261A817B|nr:hypothetical protein [uncultured Litoreibacter sp.]
MTLRTAAIAFLFATAACAPALEEDAGLSDPIIEDPIIEEAIVIEEPAPVAKSPIDCAQEEITGDGIGGTGCPTID